MSHVNDDGRTHPRVENPGNKFEGGDGAPMQAAAGKVGAKLTRVEVEAELAGATAAAAAAAV